MPTAHTEGGIRFCRVCLSPFRSEMEAAIKANVRSGEIVKKYAPLMKTTENKLYQSLRKHLLNNHAPVNAVLVPQVGQKIATLENFAQKLLEIGMDKAEKSPEKIQIKDVIAAQKAVTEKAKLKLGETELAIKMAQLFGGISPTPIQGEEVSNERVSGTNQD